MGGEGRTWRFGRSLREVEGDRRCPLIPNNRGQSVVERIRQRLVEVELRPGLVAVELRHGLGLGEIRSR